MTEPTGGRLPARPAADAAAAKAATEAARERQSHVRHDLRAPLAVIYPLLSLLLDDGAGELDAQQRELPGGARAQRRASRGARHRRRGQRLGGLLGRAGAAGRGRPRGRRRGGRRSAPHGRPGRTADRGRGGPAADAAWPGPTGTTSARSSPASCATPSTYTPSGRKRHHPGPPRRRHRRRRRRGGGHGARHASGGAGPGVRVRLPRRAGAAARAPGLGAGLWICRELAARNGGSLLLASEPGAGVRATLVLPAAAPEAGPDGIRGEQGDRLAADPARRRRPGSAHGALRRRCVSAAIEVALAQDASPR